MRCLTRAVIFALLSSACLGAEEWIIGLDADMSSGAREGGLAIQQGIELAIAEINTAGGINGRRLRLEVRDHRGNPARGIANLKELAQLDHLVAVVGGVHTPVVLAELPFIQKAELIFLDPWAAGTEITENGYQPNYVFRLSVRDEWAGIVILQQAVREGCSHVRLLLERTSWGRSNEKSLSVAAARLSLKISGIEWFNWKSEVLPALVQRLANHAIECVALVVNTPEGAAIVKAIALLPAAQRPRVYSHWGITGGDFVAQVGLKALNKVQLKYLHTLAFASPKTERGKKLLQRYLANYGPATGHNAFNGVAHAYDLVHLLAMAIRRAASSSSAHIQHALENIDEYHGAMKHYQQPFTADNHEALSIEDYLMLSFNPSGSGVL